MKERIDAAVFRDIILCASAALEQNRQLINELNVFPVPDGDTGTNMSLTMGAAATELKKRDFPTLTAAADCAASAMLRGARGNSGVILSLLFRGLAKRLKGCESADARTYAEAMTAGVDAAYKAVMKPAEGTILTVSRVSTSSAVEFAEHGGDLELMFSCAIESAQEALADTVNLNPVLKRAGVVDAGGKGYVFILEATLAVLRGEAYVPAEETAADDIAPAAEVKEKADFNDFSTGEIAYAYCTEFICGRDNPKDPDELRSFLQTLGDCVVVVDDDEIIKVHVHTNHPGKVLEEAITYGSLQTVKIENMRNQHTEILEEAAGHPAEQEAVRKVAPPEKKYGFVSVCAGDGISAVFRDLGVDGIISGGQTMNPSTEDIMKEIDKTPAEVVYVLPNNKNIIMAAEQCVPLAEGKTVVVLPSKTIPQGVSALLCFDPDTSQEDNTQAMTQALGNVHTSQITYAARNSDFDGFDIKEGDYLALSESQLFGTDRDILALLRRLAQDAPQKEAEFITVYYGEDVTESQAQTALEIFTAECPNAEITLLSGGQPVYYYLISAE